MMLHRPIPIVAIVIAFAVLSGSAAAQPGETYRLHLHVVPLSNDNGSNAPTVTTQQFARRLAIVNAWFVGTGIQFDFAPATDWEPMRNTRANSDEFPYRRVFGNDLAKKRPGKILVFLRHGSDPDPTGNGNAYPPPNANLKPVHIGDETQDYVALPSSPGGLNQSDPFVPHEFGHYLGLYHTFPGWDDRCGPVFADGSCGTASVAPLTAAQATSRIIAYAADNAKGGGLSSFDGDALSDTPPDPSITAYLAFGRDPCTNATLAVSGKDASGVTRSYTFNPVVANTMSYFGRCFRTGIAPNKRWSTQQIARMRATLKSVARKHLIEQPCGSDFHGLKASAFQNCFNYWVHRGFWPVTLAADGAVMAGSFQRGARRPVHHLISTKDYQQAVNTFAAQGFRPARVSVSRHGMETRFTAIWAPIDAPYEARHGLTLGEFEAKWKANRAKGFLNTDLHIYLTPAGLRVHAIWVKKPFADYATYYGMTGGEYEARFKDFWPKGLRVTTFVAYSTLQGRRFAAIWEKLPGNWAHYFGMTSAQYQTRYNEHAKQGLRLHQVQVYDGGTRYSAIWTKP